MARIVASLSLLLLVAAVVFAVETESSQRNQVDDKGDQQTPAAFHATNRASSGNATKDASFTEKPVVEQQDEDEDEKDEEEEEEEEDQYENEDEYVDELKAVAESHEAMSRDGGRNSNVSAGVEVPPTKERVSAKSFDSQEKSEESDEDVASNEAITDEVKNRDKEVSELLKYKKEKSVLATENGKAKRMPTVKKELSTQKEILIGSNETLPAEEGFGCANEKIDPVQRRGFAKTEPLTRSELTRKSGGIPGRNEIDVDGRPQLSAPLEENTEDRKLAERQEDFLGNLRNLLVDYAVKREKFRGLEAQKSAVLEGFSKLTAMLAWDPSRWERVTKLLMDVDNDLSLAKTTQDPTRHTYEATFSTTTSPTTAASPKKSRKKPKKKKKKPKQSHRVSTTSTTTLSTTTTMPAATPPLSTTTETPWMTTPVQWRLVAEKLFGPPWQEDLALHDDPENLAKIRYSVASKPRTLPSIRELVDQNKSKDMKNLNNERKTFLMNRERERELEREPQSRLLSRFGKVNTHQPSRLQGHREFNNGYERQTDTDRLPEYDSDPSYRLRYNQLPSRDFPRRRNNDDDYLDDFGLPSDDYNQDYRVPAYSPSKNWPEIPSYKYRPWKPEDRPLLPMSSNKWPWRQQQADPKYWPQRGKYIPDRNYWPNFTSQDETEDEESERAEVEKSWQPRLPPSRSWGDLERPNWPGEPIKIPSGWKQPERNQKTSHDQSIAWEKSKNRSELSKSPTKDDKDKIALPKITLKTWNSLTSDPATWPYKLPGAKPWPKDKNGKSYNPNAELVKKLGLDKQNTWTKETDDAKFDSKTEKQALSTSKESTSKEEFNQSDSSKYKPPADTKNFSDYRSKSLWTRKYESSTGNSWSEPKSPGLNPGLIPGLPKIRSVGAWVMPADQSTWKSYQIKMLEDENSSPGRWPVDERQWNSKESPKTSWKTSESKSWQPKSNTEAWTKINGVSPWSKTKENDSWKTSSKNYWNSKAKGDWAKSISWPIMNDNNSWTTNTDEDWPKSASWPTKGDPWPEKSSEPQSSWSKDDSWPRKVSNSPDRSSPAWQQKINEDWNVNYKNPNYNSGSTGSWQSRWKQFAYHRVTAMPISKPGTAADAAKSSKNAFVAVSAVSSPNGISNNDWRKSEEEIAVRNDSSRGEEVDRAINRVNPDERPMYAWKKDGGRNSKERVNRTVDVLERQLEELRERGNVWNYKENEIEDSYSTRSTIYSTRATTATTMTTITAPNSTRIEENKPKVMPKDNGKRFETRRQEISMK